MLGAAIGPLPSIGWPSALTTRPISASPTGIERMRPVPLTAPPSSIWSASPRTTAPIDSSSRFSARPSVPPSNSSSSLTDGVGEPGDARDAVADLEHPADLRLVERRRERLDVLAQRGCDLVGVDGQLSHLVVVAPRR